MSEVARSKPVLLIFELPLRALLELVCERSQFRVAQTWLILEFPSLPLSIFGPFQFKARRRLVTCSAKTETETVSGVGCAAEVCGAA